ncbi:hypothetical protein MKW92_027930 [Papaver armeniacum]|nr:hypothetical protein MKW92_027930 [Papaver armeniacum]
MVWVWDANRNNPVGDNATLTFGENGNLVLADVDGRIAWQTNTADKGVTGISLKSNGNLVLHDKYGRFIWQSFDYPTDTLLVSQSLKVNGKTNRLVSRTSNRDARDGPYSIVINNKGFIMYKNSSGAFLQYGGWEAKGALSVKFDSIQQDHPIAATYILTFGFPNQKQANINCTSVVPPSPQPGTDLEQAPAPAPEEPLPPVLPLQRRVILKKVYFGDWVRTDIPYNFQHSFIRLESDGNLKLYTLYMYPGNDFYWIKEAFFTLHFLLLSILLFCSSVLVQSRVPINETFQFINRGEFGGLSVEYWADYRTVEAVYTCPFGLYFYNSSPNAYILAIGASPPHKIWMMPFVWDANRNDPVGENSTLTFGGDGNLVLADVDGRIVWETNTANKGVTGISMQPNGNLVLRDKYGRSVWQSFHHPSDTLLAGQSLTLEGGEKLVSRTAYPDSREGQHSVLVDKNGLIMYLNNSGNVLQYAGWEAKGLSSVTFDSVHEEKLTTTYFLTLGFAKPYTPSKRILLKKVNYNYLHSFLRIEFDGNLRLHTANTEPDHMSWGVAYEYFGNTVEECALYRKCGLTGFCDRSICGSCPRKGSLGCMIHL